MRDGVPLVMADDGPAAPPRLQAGWAGVEASAAVGAGGDDTMRAALVGGGGGPTGRRRRRCDWSLPRWRAGGARDEGG